MVSGVSGFLGGRVASELAGAGHLAKFLTHSYEVPLRRGAADPGESCLRCHLGTPVFEAVASHHGVLEASSAGRCFECRGGPHPDFEAADFARGLMGLER